MRIVAPLFVLTFLAACLPVRQEFPLPSFDRSGQCVILLHGLGRTPASMRKIENKLSSDGFTVANIGYASRSAPIEKLSSLAVSQGLTDCREKAAATIHFVTHSLGGILLRYYLETDSISELGRTVMLAPPNQGSEAADAFRNLPGFRLLNGDAGYQLGTGDGSVPLQLGRAYFDVGIIAGDRSIDPITSLTLPNPDDGKVSVERTKVDGMNDFLVVHHSHPFIMKSDEVIEQVRRYLNSGEFDHPSR